MPSSSFPSSPVRALLAGRTLRQDIGHTIEISQRTSDLLISPSSLLSLTYELWTDGYQTSGYPQLQDGGRIMLRGVQVGSWQAVLAATWLSRDPCLARPPARDGPWVERIRREGAKQAHRKSGSHDWARRAPPPAFHQHQHNTSTQHLVCFSLAWAGRMGSELCWCSRSADDGPHPVRRRRWRLAGGNETCRTHRPGPRPARRGCAGLRRAAPFEVADEHHHLPQLRLPRAQHEPVTLGHPNAHA